MPRHALFAVAAEHRRTCDDVVARLEIGDGLADLLDYPGGLMAEDRGPGQRIEAFDEMQIAVADARCGGAHEDLVILRIVDVHLLDCQRLIGTMKYGGLHYVCSDSPQ